MGRDSFDDDNRNFLSSILKRDGLEPMPQSMARLLVVVGVVAVLAAMIAIGFAVWPHGKNGVTNMDDLPVVRADKDEIRIKPEDRGGMEIPNRNSTIFENIASDDAEKKVENLFEDEEQPMNKEDVLAKETPPQKVKPEVIAQSEDGNGEDVKSSANEKLKTPAAEEKVKADIIAALKEEVRTAGAYKPPVGSKYIQLASVKSDEDAKAKWVKLQAKFPALKGATLRVQRADLGAKGIFFRVQAGPMAAEDAQKICSLIKSSKGDCLLVK